MEKILRMIRDDKNLNFHFISEIIAKNLETLTRNHKNVVFIFIGTDANTGDSLGPLAGTLLNFSSKRIYTYGSLESTITAKEVPYIARFIKKTHPTSFIIVIDAALGKKQDIGQIKVIKEGILPGLGVNKKLPLIGDAAIIGIVGEKTTFGENTLYTTRLSHVYEMATVIKNGIFAFAKQKDSQESSYLVQNNKLTI